MNTKVPNPEPSVAGLARELESLRRAVDGLAALPAQVADLAGIVASLADRVKPGRGGGDRPSWLELSGDFADAVGVLGELADWMHAVYLRYTDAIGGLPECWLWHPDVVQELLWLRAAWVEAHDAEPPSVGRVGEWHDRLRPGVARRIRAVAGTCSLEAHQPGGERHRGAAPVPLAEAIHTIGEWWTSDRGAIPPAPDTGHIAAATALRVPRGRR